MLMGSLVCDACNLEVLAVLFSWSHICFRALIVGMCAALLQSATAVPGRDGQSDKQVHADRTGAAAQCTAHHIGHTAAASRCLTASAPQSAPAMVLGSDIRGPVAMQM